MAKKEHKALIRRYLLWAFKTTLESFERIERKTTQLMVDEFILKRINKPAISQKQIKEFEAYIKAKRADELKLKFTDAKGKTLHPQYVYLKNRLQAVEEAVRHFLGEKEKEFTNRILQARDH
jgi:hypothetical protein